MKTITLKNKSKEGEDLEVTYLPEMGMNMASYKKGGIEVIDQSTKGPFQNHFSGLGPLIGPHFYRRNPKVIPAIDNEEAFPHIARVKAEGADFDPFSHGIGRYAPWNYEQDAVSVHGILKGSDIWNGVLLKDLEGQNFTMRFSSTLTPEGLDIELSVVGDTDTIVGIHYYYHLPLGRGRIIGKVQKKYIDIDKVLPIPASWSYDPSTCELNYPLDQAADFTFHPFPDPTHGDILLDAETYKLRTRFLSDSQECSFQLYHPRGASFVCVEPTSAQDPRHANLTVSSLKINLEILI